MPLLELSDLCVAYGPIEALHGIALNIAEGQIVALIGANGAGKSTTLRTISGLLKPRRGTIQLEGRPLTGLAPHEIVRRGVSHVPEGRGIFANLTVAENLDLGACLRRDAGRLRRDRDEVFDLFPRLSERLHQ
ncbi:MAG: ABC transporter ATP-binding protein, partial [Planctomycetaceae bacterium]